MHLLPYMNFILAINLANRHNLNKDGKLIVKFEFRYLLNIKESINTSYDSALARMSRIVITQKINLIQCLWSV